MDPSSTAVAALLRQSGVEIESIVRGSSMSPTLVDGDRIRIRCGQRTHEPGDIIAFLAEPLIAHRVVLRAEARSQRYLITRGDACWLCDAPVPEEFILGVVTAQHDGADWRPPRPVTPPTGLGSLITAISLRSVRAALGVSLGCANAVAQIAASIASWRDRRA